MHAPKESEIPPVLLGIPWPALRGPFRNHLWKKKRPQPYWGGDNSGNALESSNALNYRAWGIPARTLDGNSRKRSESVSGVFLESFRNFFWKVPAALGVWPLKKKCWKLLCFWCMSLVSHQQQSKESMSLVAPISCDIAILSLQYPISCNALVAPSTGWMLCYLCFWGMDWRWMASPNFRSWNLLVRAWNYFSGPEVSSKIPCFVS